MLEKTRQSLDRSPSQEATVNFRWVHVCVEDLVDGTDPVRTAHTKVSSNVATESMLSGLARIDHSGYIHHTKMSRQRGGVRPKKDTHSKTSGRI
jgi:hypothetical protein